MTLAQLDEIEAREKAATPGPWAWKDGEDSCDLAILAAPPGEVCNFGCGEMHYPTEGKEPSAPDSEFIAHAREDIPALLAEVRRLRKALGQLISETLTPDNLELREHFRILKKDAVARALAELKD